ncbi:MAG: tRNA pseudouridine(54/55) synthase Pus10 [Candidatus Kariarchaeaceae archaeon]
MELVNQIKGLLENEKSCLRCVGRAISQNDDMSIDSSITHANKLPDDIVSLTVSEEDCDICEGVVKKSLTLTGAIINELRKREFSSFLVGCKLSKNQLSGDEIYNRYEIHPLGLKQEINREIGLRILAELGQEVDLTSPDITIIVEPKKRPRFKLQVKSIYLLGRYCKLVRGIPQTKWPCTHCKGKGCTDCNSSGQQYPHTVEGVISTPLMKLFGSALTSFHGAGREDIDALMLGSGRPFVLELKDPINRTADLTPAIDSINGSGMVTITDLQDCERSVIVLLKEQSSHSTKQYRAIVSLKHQLNPELLHKLEVFGKKENKISQQTPVRVSHRRADKIREKKIFQLSILEQSPKQLTLEITAQGGTYIKEFISGDGGRSIPNLSSLLNTQAVCTELDVLSVDDKGLFQ